MSQVNGQTDLQPEDGSGHGGGSGEPTHGVQANPNGTAPGTQTHAHDTQMVTDAHGAPLNGTHGGPPHGEHDGPPDSSSGQPGAERWPNNVTGTPANQVGMNDPQYQGLDVADTQQNCSSEPANCSSCVSYLYCAMAPDANCAGKSCDHCFPYAHCHNETLSHGTGNQPANLTQPATTPQPGTNLATGGPAQNQSKANCNDLASECTANNCGQYVYCATEPDVACNDANEICLTQQCLDYAQCEEETAGATVLPPNDPVLQNPCINNQQCSECSAWIGCATNYNDTCADVPQTCQSTACQSYLAQCSAHTQLRQENGINLVANNESAAGANNETAAGANNETAAGANGTNSGANASGINGTAANGNSTHETINEGTGWTPSCRAAAPTGCSSCLQWIGCLVTYNATCDTITADCQAENCNNWLQDCVPSDQELLNDNTGSNNAVNSGNGHKPSEGPAPAPGPSPTPAPTPSPFCQQISQACIPCGNYIYCSDQNQRDDNCHFGPAACMTGECDQWANCPTMESSTGHGSYDVEYGYANVENWDEYYNFAAVHAGDTHAMTGAPSDESRPINSSHMNGAIAAPGEDANQVLGLLPGHAQANGHGPTVAPQEHLLGWQTMENYAAKPDTTYAGDTETWPPDREEVQQWEREQIGASGVPANDVRKQNRREGGPSQHIRMERGKVDMYKLHAQEEREAEARRATPPPTTESTFYNDDGEPNPVLQNWAGKNNIKLPGSKPESLPHDLAAYELDIYSPEYKEYFGPFLLDYTKHTIELDGWNFVVMSDRNIPGKGNVIAGNENFAKHADNSFVSGANNMVTGHAVGVYGGDDNVVDGDGVVDVGGQENSAKGNFSVVDGGFRDEAIGQFSVVSGGSRNIVQASYSTSTGGSSNFVGGTDAGSHGGYGNEVMGDLASSPGGLGSHIDGVASMVAGVGVSDTKSFDEEIKPMSVQDMMTAEQIEHVPADQAYYLSQLGDGGENPFPEAGDEPKAAEKK